MQKKEEKIKYKKKTLYWGIAVLHGVPLPMPANTGRGSIMVRGTRVINDY